MPSTPAVSYPIFFAFRAEARTAEALRDVAKAEGLTLSDVIRDALHQRLSERCPPARPERASLSANH